MQKIGNRRLVPSLLNPHSPLRLDLLKDKSLPWLTFFLLQAPSPKLIHNAFQSVGVSVFATGAYVITFIGFSPELCWHSMLHLIVYWILYSQCYPWAVRGPTMFPLSCVDTQCYP
jgi:hypothetical protein